MIKLHSIPPSHRNERNEKTRHLIGFGIGRMSSLPPKKDEAGWQIHRWPKGHPKIHISVFPIDEERKLKELQEIEGFIAEGLGIGLVEFALNLRKEIEMLKSKNGNNADRPLVPLSIGRGDA